MIELGSYQRKIKVPSKLLIENERDWEHLPHVHSAVFSDIRLISMDRAGWIADVTFTNGGIARLRVNIDEDLLGWTQITTMAGHEIAKTVTSLRQLADDETEVIVTFSSAQTPNFNKEETLAFYRSLYANLLDEDERKVLARHKSIAAGIDWRREIRIVALADGSEHKMPLACPHKGLPLDCEPDEGGIVTCPWHGYQFDVKTGACVSGQIRGWKLEEGKE